MIHARSVAAEHCQWAFDHGFTAADVLAAVGVGFVSNASWGFAVEMLMHAYRRLMATNDRRPE